MGLLKEFKDFALKGNVMDMAVGVIIGGAFSTIVSGLTQNILQPVLSLVTQAMSLEEWKAAMPGNVSALLTAIVDFLITAFVLFVIIKGVKAAEDKAAAIAAAALGKKEDEEAPAPTTKVCPYCKSEIPIDAVKCAHCTSDVE